MHCSSILLQTNLHKVTELEFLARKSLRFMDTWVQVCPEGTGFGKGRWELYAVWCIGEAVAQEDLALEGCGSQMFIDGAKLHVLLIWSQI